MGSAPAPAEAATAGPIPIPPMDVTPPMLALFSKWLEPIREKLPPELDAQSAADLQQAITEEALRRFAAFLQGVKVYRQHEAAREDPQEIETVWTNGTTRLLDYAPMSGGAPILVIPSLVNRFEILDIDGEHSFLRFLAAQGLRPFVLDWNEPGEKERRFTLSDYIEMRIVPALDIAQERAGGQTCHILGYCMGGLLAMALALLKPDAARSLILLATPWDFSESSVGGVPPVSSMLGTSFMQQAQHWETVLAQVGYLPTDFLQAIFTGFQPLQVLQKFMRFGDLEPGSETARRFVLTEDWLNDGVPLALPVALECFKDWYGANLPAKSAWRAAGIAVDPAALSLPTYILIAGKDRIVPPASSLPLAQLIRGAKLHQPMIGHIGLMAGDAAPQEVWKPLAEWLLSDETGSV